MGELNAVEGAKTLMKWGFQIPWGVGIDPGTIAILAQGICARRTMVETYPLTEPLFLPLPANPPLSCTPAHSPSFPSISPMKRRVPSYPRDSILTLSPTSNARPALLELLPNTSECRLGGRTAVGVFGRSAGVFGREALIADDVDATEDGRPATDRRPDWAKWEVDAD